MKQTKNALSMLLNAYRAIFKSAYFKGMASAVVLTAGLAAGAANAEANNIAEWLSGGGSLNYTVASNNSVYVTAPTIAGDLNIISGGNASGSWGLVLANKLTSNVTIDASEYDLTVGDIVQKSSSKDFMLGHHTANSGSISAIFNNVTIESGAVVWIAAGNKSGVSGAASLTALNDMDIDGDVLVSGGSGAATLKAKNLEVTGTLTATSATAEAKIEGEFISASGEDAKISLKGVESASVSLGQKKTEELLKPIKIG